MTRKEAEEAVVNTNGEAIRKADNFQELVNQELAKPTE